MIEQNDIRRAANQWGLDAHIIEQDYVLGWLLWGIAKHPALSASWILKGGSAIKKCYIDTHRYSQDLDFTVLPDGPREPDELSALFAEVLVLLNDASGINFTCRDPIFKARPHGQSCEGAIYYIGPRGNPSPAAIKLDIAHAEDLMRPPVLRSISHPYLDSFPDETRIYCYSLEELFAEKIRALKERARPRDLYDIVYLFRRSDLHAEPELIGEILEHKCGFKQISTPTISDIHTADYRNELEIRWEPMLGRSLGQLPELEDYWSELLNFFGWLSGEDYAIELLPVTEETAWHPVPLVWQSGQQELIEPIRHAAVNRLMINLGYGNKQRLVEPYSLRLTQAGFVLFYALKANVRQIRSYRLDRIQSVEVTHKPFKPAFRIEFTPEGRIPTPLTQRRRRFASSSKQRSSRGQYVVECAACGKRFYRKNYSASLNPHTRKDAKARCSGRHGYLV